MYRSTRHHRYTQRVNAGLQLAGEALKSFSPEVMLSIKVGQSVSSVYSIFRNNLTVPEKIINAFQLLLSATQAGILMYAVGAGVSCSPIAGVICTSILVLELVYHGVLLTNWPLSEISKINDESLALPDY